MLRLALLPSTPVLAMLPLPPLASLPLLALLPSLPVHPMLPAHSDTLAASPLAIAHYCIRVAHRRRLGHLVRQSGRVRFRIVHLHNGGTGGVSRAGAVAAPEPAVTPHPSGRAVSVRARHSTAPTHRGHPRPTWRAPFRLGSGLMVGRLWARARRDALGAVRAVLVGVPSPCLRARHSHSAPPAAAPNMVRTVPFRVWPWGWEAFGARAARRWVQCERRCGRGTHLLLVHCPRRAHGQDPAHPLP